MISIQDLSKGYYLKGQYMPVLKHVDLEIQAGELVALMGQSGTGKSTLLNVIGLLDTHDAGTYRLQNHLVENLTENAATALRARLIGFVFQRFHLIPFKTAWENVALPLYYQNMAPQPSKAKALALLDKVGLADHAYHLPNELSGGQQQRVAIARALVTEAPLVLADEPTGALDSHTSTEIMALLQQLHQEGKTILIVTHSQEVARSCKRMILMQDGKIVANQTVS